APGQLRRVAFLDNPDAVAVDDHEVTIDLDLAREAAMHRVIAGQVRVRLGVAEIVDRDDPDLPGTTALIKGTQDVPADTTVTVDCDFDCHLSNLPVCYLMIRSAAAATLSAVNPKCLNTSPAGADSPKLSIPTTA